MRVACIRVGHAQITGGLRCAVGVLHDSAGPTADADHGHVVVPEMLIVTEVVVPSAAATVKTS
jgi:hypothetical protein